MYIEKDCNIINIIQWSECYESDILNERKIGLTFREEISMHRRSILVVEDQRLNQAILKEVLEGEYNVTYTGNGQEAMEIDRKSTV